MPVYEYRPGTCRHCIGLNIAVVSVTKNLEAPLSPSDASVSSVSARTPSLRAQESIRQQWREVTCLQQRRPPLLLLLSTHIYSRRPTFFLPSPDPIRRQTFLVGFDTQNARIVCTQSLIAVKGGVKQPSHAIAHELETSPETCSCVAASDNGQLMAGAFGKNVRIYASNPSGFHSLAEVQVRKGRRKGGREGGTEEDVSLLLGVESREKFFFVFKHGKNKRSFASEPIKSGRS